MSPTYDVVVAGSGNAALCAALAAREAGASVLIVEKAPESQRGGNSFFTAGGFRFAHQGLEDLRRDILPDISEEEARDADQVVADAAGPLRKPGADAIADHGQSDADEQRRG